MAVIEYNADTRAFWSPRPLPSTSVDGMPPDYVDASPSWPSRFRPNPIDRLFDLLHETNRCDANIVSDMLEILSTGGPITIDDIIKYRNAGKEAVKDILEKIEALRKMQVEERVETDRTASQERMACEQMWEDGRLQRQQHYHEEAMEMSRRDEHSDQRRHDRYMAQFEAQAQAQAPSLTSD